MTLGTEALPSCAPHVVEAVEGTVRDEASEGGGTVAAHWLPTRPPSTGAAASMNDDCTEWMYWGRTPGKGAVR